MLGSPGQPFPLTIVERPDLDNSAIYTALEMAARVQIAECDEIVRITPGGGPAIDGVLIDLTPNNVWTSIKEYGIKDVYVQVKRGGPSPC